MASPAIGAPLGAYLGATYPAPEEEDAIMPKKTDGIDLIRMFPAAFTMVCFVIFLVPVWLILTVAENQALSYFSSRWAYVVLAAPVIILLVHLVHLRQGVPNKFGVLAALMIPSIICLIIANRQFMNATDKMDKLFSVDCDTFPQKRQLQVAWESAYNLYMDCLNTTAATSNYPLEVLQQNFRIQDCAEYQSRLSGKWAFLNNYADEWNYLRYLEENHYCSGWCYHGVQLWSSKPHKDSCAIVVSNLFRSLVTPHTKQVSVVMLACLAVTAVIIIIMGPALRKQGLEW